MCIRDSAVSDRARGRQHRGVEAAAVNDADARAAADDRHAGFKRDILKVGSGQNAHLVAGAGGRDGRLDHAVRAAGRTDRARHVRSLSLIHI